jgi:uncharacterized repeat protein (TIGR03803 family)
MKRIVRHSLFLVLAVLGVGAGSPNADAGAPVTIYRFTGGADGYGPMGALVSDAAGNLYGTGIQGGQSNRGVVFQLKPPTSPSGSWTEVVLHSFAAGSDGSFPQAGMIFDAVGNLYGTTAYGGNGPDCSTSGLGGCGTVFKFSPPSAGQSAWTETVLYRFSGGADGYSPLGPLVLDATGNLYGTTVGGGDLRACRYGCGVAFELSPSPSGAWTETVLHTFNGRADGWGPANGLTFDRSGNLYGTTKYGGLKPNCCGTVFELSPPASPTDPWLETVLHSFAATADGRLPTAGVVFDPFGNLYGATQEGDGTGRSCTGGCGGVFELSPSAAKPVTWTEKLLYRFLGGADGAKGFSAIYQGGNVYGTAGGGTSGFGVVFVLSIPAPKPPKKWWVETADPFTGFGGSNPGASPEGALIIDPSVSGGATFYGAAHGGGLLAGSVYSWTP